MRKFLCFIFFYLFALNACYSSDLTLNNSYKFLDSTKQKSSDDPLKLLFEEGIKAYEKHNYNNAISIWKNVLKVNEKKKDVELGYRTKVNIGAAYNAIGYHKTASQYFISVNSAQKKNKNDMYWVNNINIGVCYMSLEQYDLAKQYFESTKEITPYISFVKKLNLAKWYGLNNNKSKFFAFQKEVSNQIKKYPMFESIWEEVQLEFLISWKEKAKLKNLLQDLKPKYKTNNLFLKLKTNQGLLLLDDKPLEDISGILKYENEVNSSNDLFLKNLYFKYLKEFYFKQNNINLYRKFDNFWEDSNEKFVKEKNLVYLEDFKAAERLEELQGKFSQEQLKNQLIQNQLSKSNLMFRFSIIVIIMGLGIIFLIIRNYKKNKKILLLNAVQSQNEILKKEFEKIELSENLKETSEELNTSIFNIKKVALLKKQLENIADEKDPNYNEKETLKKLKLCLNSFFDNYRELTQIMQKKLNVDKIISYVNINFPEITEKEKRVIEYITLHFTTKEIALLMDKSEKSIEYYRSQIRKKMNLGSNSSLEEFLNSFF
jgi:DNA-binding CsgD family transcriptional regulator/tetratricopeptide (TPR) repeat protein